MGQSTTKQRKKPQITNQDQLKFYTEVYDPNLGMVKIYTCRKYQLCYILKYQRIQQDTKIYNIFKKIEINNLNPLLSLYGYNVERKTCCNKICDQSVCSYWEYYNFYFNQYLERRRKQNIPLIDSEIWHIVEICCETYSLFRKFGVYYEINPETFVITPEGKLKAFWCHLRSQNSHIKFFQYFDQNYKVHRFAYSPQQLQCMHEQQRTTKLDFDKCNAYRLGMLLLECLTLIDPLFNCYNPSMTAIFPCIIRHIIMSKIMPHYPVEIVNLIKGLLREDPKKRISLAQVYEEYYSKFNPEYELRVCGMINNQDSQNRQQDYLDLRRIQQNQQENEHFHVKKGSDESDEKTVKFRHSFRRN